MIAFGTAAGPDSQAGAGDSGGTVADAPMGAATDAFSGIPGDVSHGISADAFDGITTNAFDGIATNAITGRATDPLTGIPAGDGRSVTSPEDTERLGDEIARLAAHLHAATYRLLVLIREFDERGGWGGGFRSCAEWLSWRTGIAPGAAREKVRVAGALAHLPRISEAMARGEMSYSKVRALTRVATAENETELLEVARHATAAHLERLVRAWRRVDRIEEAERERERGRHRSRYLRLYPDEDGSYVLTGRLDPEVGALLKQALAWASEALYRQEAADEAEEVAGTGKESPTAGQRRADAVGLVAERAMMAAAVAALEEEREPGASFGRSGSALPLGRADRFEVVVHVDAGALETGSENGAAVLEESGLGVSAETSRRLACDAGVVEMTHDTEGQVLDVGRRRRTVPPAIRRALEHRDRGCSFPGCGCRYTDAHHIVHWADGGETKLENLILICRRHHRLLHEEGYRVELVEGGRDHGSKEGGAAGSGRGRKTGAGAGQEGSQRTGVRAEARFYRPDGRPIPAVPEPAVVPPEPVAALMRTNEEHGIEPDEWTATPLWLGETFDYSLALDMLRHPLARARQARLARGRGVSAET